MADIKTSLSHINPETCTTLNHFKFVYLAETLLRVVGHPHSKLLPEDAFSRRVEAGQCAESSVLLLEAILAREIEKSCLRRRQNLEVLGPLLDPIYYGSDASVRTGVYCMCDELCAKILGSRIVERTLNGIGTECTIDANVKRAAIDQNIFWLAARTIVEQYLPLEMPYAVLSVDQAFTGSEAMNRRLTIDITVRIP